MLINSQIHLFHINQVTNCFIFVMYFAEENMLDIIVVVISIIIAPTPHVLHLRISFHLSFAL